MPTKKSKAKKPIAKKSVAKVVKKVVKKPAKKVAKTIKKAAPKKITAIKEAYTKTQLIEHIIKTTNLAKKDVSVILSTLGDVITAHLKKNAIGEFSLPGLAKFRTVRKPATRARKGTNPFTGEPTVFKAKSACNIIKIKPLKKLKDIIA
ncbi:MAG: HU family DNA-binding protein [Gammaproteobacteria bacterium]|nr:HU family DNA-binding protein [Gammaproteobacteria bacterium]